MNEKEKAGQRSNLPCCPARYHYFLMGGRLYPLFAVSFMDAIDPRDRVKDDLSFLDGILAADDAESM